MTYICHHCGGIVSVSVRLGGSKVEKLYIEDDAETVWSLACDYICSILEVQEYLYEGDNFPTVAEGVPESAVLAIEAMIS